MVIIGLPLRWRGKKVTPEHPIRLRETIKPLEPPITPVESRKDDNLDRDLVGEVIDTGTKNHAMATRIIEPIVIPANIEPLPKLKSTTPEVHGAPYEGA